MDSKYVLLLCPICKDGKDIAGNRYREVGDFIQSKKFVKDGDIDTGLYGILWGKRPTFPQNNILNLDWAVVKTEVNENLLMLDRNNNEVKFKRGIILCRGKIKKCANYILSIKNDKKQYFIEDFESITADQIIGADQWIERQRKK